jgi:hypothetical protein
MIFMQRYTIKILKIIYAKIKQIVFFDNPITNFMIINKQDCHYIHINNTFLVCLFYIVFFQKKKFFQ